jgi:alpha-beta hydrolase superfamily lysophospholipase
VKVRAREHFFKSSGARLFFRVWEAPGERAVVLLVHGLGEHSGRHAALAGRLREAGFSTAAFDLRGHGRSGGWRGHVDRFDQHAADLGVFRRVVEDQGRSGPRFLLGHDVGALVAVWHVVEEGPGGLDGLVLSSPAFAPRVAPGPLRLGAARLLERLAPAFPLAHGIRPESLTHDAEERRAYARDRLVQRRGSVRALLEILRAMSGMRDRGTALTLPLMVLGGHDDPVVSPDAMREFVERAGSSEKRLLLYAGLYHDVFHEIARDRAIGDLLAWLEARLP